jgi:thiol-disulfide isomerase/thioredoxin
LKKKKTSEYFNEIKVAFNKDKVIERRFGDKSQTTYYFLHYDFNALKGYTCTVAESYKQALQFDFKEPSTTVGPLINTEQKTIIDFPCEKGKVMINGKAKDIYYTKKIGLRYCKNFKIDGFLMEYPGYSKNLGFYTVKAKKIVYNDLPDSFFSLDGFTIQTPEDIKKAQQDRLEKTNETRMKFIGEKADTFKALSLTNEKIDTKKFLGDVIVYNFWFTTCGPCKAEIPKLNQLKEKYKGKNVHFIAIALDPDYKIIPFLNKIPLNYDIIPEGQWVSEKFDVHSYPTNIIVDKNGIVQFYEVGYRTDIAETMTFALDKYLEQ